MEPGVYSVLRDGRSFEVRIVPSLEGYAVYVGRDRFHADVRDPRNMSRSHDMPLGTGRQQVASPMPGKVVRVLVNEGQEVEPEQGLVVVEAMKMQNELKASRAGKVSKVNVKNGATVGAGEVLVVVE